MRIVDGLDQLLYITSPSRGSVLGLIYLSSGLVRFLLPYRRSGLRRRAFFSGPMTDDDGRPLPVVDERYRRDHDKGVDAIDFV